MICVDVASAKIVELVQPSMLLFDGSLVQIETIEF